MADFGPELVRYVKRNWWIGLLVFGAVVFTIFLIVRGIGTL